jgi:hypothetical protein
MLLTTTKTVEAKQDKKKIVKFVCYSGIFGKFLQLGGTEATQAE